MSFFISIEGIEGAGKSTLVQAVIQFLQERGLDVCATREPGGTPLAESIRHVLLHAHPDEGLLSRAELLLMFASRIQHVETLIKPALARGAYVVCDRFVDASFAYQGGGRGLGFAEIQPIADYALGGLLPDLTLLLDLEVSVALQRLASRSKDKIEQEDAAFFERVRQAYLTRANDAPRRIKIIDASQSIEAVIEQACHCVLDGLKRAQDDE